MTEVWRHVEQVAGLERVRFASQAEFALATQHLNHRLLRRSVFGQFLPFGKSKQHHARIRRTQHRPAHDAVGGKLRFVRQRNDFFPPGINQRSFTHVRKMSEQTGWRFDLYQGKVNPVCQNACVTSESEQVMPPLNKFKRFDVREMIRSGIEPFPFIRERVNALPTGEGLIIVAPILPSPLIEKLGSEGFASKVEGGSGADWLVYLWREAV